MAFTIKKGDTLPVINATLTSGPSSGSQSPVNVTGATIKLIMKPTGGGSATLLTATIVSGPSGTVKYDWVAGDTAISGTFNCEWEVTFSGGLKQTFPNDSYFTIVIGDDLG